MTISDAERIKALEDELAGARFAADQHLNTVKLQKTIIARFTEQAPIQSAGTADDELAKLKRYSESCGEGGGVYPDQCGDYVKLEDVRAALAVPATAPTVQAQTALRIKIDYRAPFGERGYMEVIAEEFTIPGVAEHHFAVHNSVDVPGEYVATHIETGFAVARGETPDFAIELARNNWTKCSPESLALKLIRAKNQSKVPRAPRAAPSIYEVQRNAAEAAISSELDSLFGPCDAAQQPIPPAAPSLTDAPSFESAMLHLSRTLTEIPLCYPWGTGHKLVREPNSLKWLSRRDSTGAAQYLADKNSNAVNSTIAAVARVLVNVSRALSGEPARKEG